jgi:Family of unknown function (DUF6194)
VETQTYGECTFFYNLNGKLPRGVYFVTIKDGDGPNDKASNLNRDGVYRVNIGVGKEVYEALFGLKPARPKKGGVIEANIDFTQLNEFTPHPIYAWLYWVAILSPDETTKEQVIEYIDTAYNLAQEKFNIKTK